ncbi:MAG TPA: hypothetical protein VF597_01720 [Candidatus Saccharimonadales bacterium]|jgi:hypothetical protein
MEENAIISVSEFRVITGITPAVMEDSKVIEAIRQLDVMAQIYIKKVKSELQNKE